MKRRWPYALAAGAVAFVSFAGVGNAQPSNDGPAAIDISSLSDGDPVPGRYVVIMAEEPLVAQFGQDQVKSRAADKAAKGLKKGHDRALSAAGVSRSAVTADYTVSMNGFAVAMDEGQAAKMASVDGVLTVVQDVWREAQTDNSGDFLGLNSPGGLRAKGFDGEGVVIGVVDTGIWPEHPSFADDGSYSDLGITLDETNFAACDFGNSGHNGQDAPFECNNKLIGARQTIPTYRAIVGAESYEFDSARDDNGHGTHTASTAAGNAGVSASILGVDRGTVTGVAPRARVIAYKGLGDLGGFGSDLAASIDQAVADGVDVINYSIGSSSSAIGPDDIAFLFAADAGVFVATSNGNDGPAPATTGSPASVPWVTSVGASTQDRTFQGSASSPDGWEFFGESVTDGTAVLPLVDAANAGDELCNIGLLDPALVSGKIVLCKRGAIARVDKGLAVAIAGGAGMILYNANDGQSQVTDTHFLPAVHINNTDGVVIKDYIANTAEPMAQIHAGVLAPTQGSVMAGFSSRGPNSLSADIIKPDVTAPGVNILAGNTPAPVPGNVAGELFQSISGTSMSSPHVAGLFALIKQAHPDWTSAVAKSALMTTSRQDVTKEDAATPADAFDMGAGHVDPSTSGKGSIFEPGLAYDVGFFDYLGFLCDADPGQLSPTTCPFLDSIGVATDAANLNLASIGIAGIPGSQTVSRTVTSVASDNGWRTYDVSVDAPAGFDVSVVPSTIRLKPGQSATYEVTVTTTSAPAGVWRHGSLTWNDRSGQYNVYSPIAVNGALFVAPDTAYGAGVDGNTSFDVTFGYTGAYSAAAHGLVAATVNSGNVAQDPDQNFDPSDGYSDAVTVTTSGAALLRFALPPDAVADSAVDIDLFLFDPSGNEVASSTNGGTDEFIEIVSPENGDWTLYVHGWQAAGPSAAYDLYSWVVSATPGGNMSIDSAPASAVIGVTSSIDVSWTGASGSEWHLGAVSHADDSGPIGLTLVEVDNR